MAFMNKTPLTHYKVLEKQNCTTDFYAYSKSAKSVDFELMQRGTISHKCDNKEVESEVK